MLTEDGPVIDACAVSINALFNAIINRINVYSIWITATGYYGKIKNKKGSWETMTNNRNEFVQNSEDIHEYLKRMIDNARKHGIMITGVFINAPMIDKGCDCITPYGKRHPELLIKSCGKCGLEMLHYLEDDADLSDLMDE